MWGDIGLRKICADCTRILGLYWTTTATKQNTFFLWKFSLIVYNCCSSSSNKWMEAEISITRTSDILAHGWLRFECSDWRGGNRTFTATQTDVRWKKSQELGYYSKLTSRKWMGKHLDWRLHIMWHADSSDGQWQGVQETSHLYGWKSLSSLPEWFSSGVRFSRSQQHSMQPINRQTRTMYLISSRAWTLISLTGHTDLVISDQK